MAVQRKRIYATIAYPESVNPDFVEILKSKCIPCFISPLHDKDKNPDGETKKEHYHILFMFDGVKTISQVKEICDEIKSVGVEPVESVRGYARYLCHLDNPEKYKYPVSEVQALSGADYMATIQLPTDKYVCVRDMIEFVIQHDIRFYADLFDYSARYNYEWFHSLCDCTSYVMKEYIQSRAMKNAKKPNIPLN